jgi:hypothetical protein
MIGILGNIIFRTGWRTIPLWRFAMFQQLFSSDGEALDAFDDTSKDFLDTEAVQKILTSTMTS